MLKKVKSRLSRPKITFSRLGQIIFTFREVTKLLVRIERRYLILVFGLNAIWGFSAIPGFYLEKLILDRLVANIGNPNWQVALYAIGFFAFLRVILELGRLFVFRLSRFLSRRLSRQFDAELELLIGEKMSELDIATIESPEFKDKFNKIEREARQRAFNLMMPVSYIPGFVVGFISAAGVLLLLHPLVTLGVLIFSIPQLYVDSRFIKKEYELVTAFTPLRRIWGWLSYYLIRNRDFIEIKTLNLSDHLSRRLRDIQREILAKEISLMQKRELSNVGSLSLFTLFEFGVILWLSFLVIIGKITIGSFEFYLRTLRSAQNNFSELVSSFLEIYENYIFVADLVWFLNLEPQIRSKPLSRKINTSKSGDLTFVDVWFRYRPKAGWILKGINLRVKPGEKIAIVGENGAGKSTLIKLIARFYDPNKGRVLYDGASLTELDMDSWRKNLAILFQQFEGYPFSAKESIGYGDIDRISDFSDIKDSARKTGVDEFIEDLPLRYENPLSPEFEKGIQPSSGQWQRIGISRMFFRKRAGILIMDEPTSNVDPESEEQIFKELAKVSRGKILIFVTQRFSTVRIADRIVVMDKGQIVEQGTHKELMKKDGKYAKLFNLQAKGYQ